MTTPNALAHAIRTAIVQELAASPPEPPAELLAEDARDALASIETSMHAISEIVRPAHNERMFLGLQLLRASCDHGRAMTFLLGHNPLDMMGSALALHRAQIENFLRGVFYAEIATAEQLADFFEEDKGPRRKNHNDKWQPIGVRELAGMVEERIHQVEGSGEDKRKLTTTVENAWSPLCGMVHGGIAIHKLYDDGQRQIGCSTSADVFFETTINAVVMVNYSLTMSCAIAGIGGNEENEALGPPLRRFGQFMDQHNARLRQAGLANMQRFPGD